MELKRLKAFFNLVEAINPEFKANKNFKSFRRIAKNTGGLRDAQVQQELLGIVNKSLNLDASEYERYLKKIEISYIERFHSFSQTKPIKKLKDSKKIVGRAIKTVSPLRSETRAQGRFYNLKNNLILLNREDELGEDILHKVRILAKETHYNLEIIQRCFNLYTDLKDFIKELKKVHQALGKWHDFDVGNEYLTDFLAGYDNGSSLETYMQLVNYYKNEREMLKKNFRTVFNRFTETAALI